MAQRVALNDAAGPKRTARVRVAVRLRPYMDKQDEKSEGPCVRGLGPQTLEIVNWRNSTESLQYQFDVFHGEQSTQQEVFLSSVKPIIPYVLNGQNASVFAYGPTGAGKTHTMLGSEEQPGLIPRAVREVFQLVRTQVKDQDEWEFSVGMSYLEIYNEKVLDLLSPNSQDLPIREDKDKNIIIPGLTRTSLSSFSDFHTHFVPASMNRTTASTKLNQRSSRSHAILLIKVVKCQRVPPHRQQTGKLYLVDLAGSEDNRRTGNQGIRLKESGAINLSLFTLSKVVDCLNTGTGGRVPYRDSKLTRLLQDSLGGSAHSVMITNIAPEYKYYFDTFTALNFAAKSKQIINRPFVRETVIAPTNAAGKRSREEQDAGGSGEPQNKRLKEGKKVEQPSPPLTQPHSPVDSSVLDRLMALEKMMLGTPERERLKLLKTVAQSRKEIQRLKEKQKELEEKAEMLNKLTGGQSVPNDEREDTTSSRSLFKTDLPPLQQKQSVSARPRKQQAIVTPLQVSQVQALQECAVVCKTSQTIGKKKKHIKKEISEGKENSSLEPACEEEANWESKLDSSLLDQSKKKILQTLNSGSLKELKSLQLIGDKKAKLILGWREINGAFAQDIKLSTETCRLYSFYHSLHHYKYHTFLICKKETNTIEQASEDPGQEEVVQQCMANQSWLDKLFNAFLELLSLSAKA